jgi:hypothetical protein
MQTVRQIERQWEAKSYNKLASDVLATRPEGTFRHGLDTSRAVPAAALAIIRLDELSQSSAKIYSKLIRTLIAAQEADGGWGDLVTTALSLRALLCGSGDGAAIQRGMAYLANLQKSEGIWPNIPMRRMPGDPYISALILYELGENPAFHHSVRVADAMRWFGENESAMDQATRQLWARVQKRCRPQLQRPMLETVSLS